MVVLALRAQDSKLLDLGGADSELICASEKPGLDVVTEELPTLSRV